MLVPGELSQRVLDVVALGAVVNEVLGGQAFRQVLAPVPPGGAAGAERRHEGRHHPAGVAGGAAGGHRPGAGAARGRPGTPVTLAAGALLLCGLFAGKVAKGLGLPRLTGYLLVGVAVGPYALGFIPNEGVKGLELVKGLAVSLIALAAGTELHLGLSAGWAPGWPLLCAAVCGATFVVCFGAPVRAQAAAALHRVR